MARPSRRDVLKLGMVAAGVVGLTGIVGLRRGAREAGPERKPQLRGGIYSHGATGGSSKDTLDPYFPVTNPDIARCLQLYEPLLRWNAEYKIEPAVAESVTPYADNTDVDDQAARGRDLPQRQDAHPRGRPVHPGQGHRPQEARAPAAPSWPRSST